MQDQSISFRKASLCLPAVADFLVLHYMVPKTWGPSTHPLIQTYITNKCHGIGPTQALLRAYSICFFRPHSRRSLRSAKRFFICRRWSVLFERSSRNSLALELVQRLLPIPGRQIADCPGDMLIGPRFSIAAFCMVSLEYCQLAINLNNGNVLRDPPPIAAEHRQ